MTPQKIIFMVGILAVLPRVVFAQQFTDFVEFGQFVLKLLSGIISILFALAALGLMYGVIQYFLNSDNNQVRENFRPYLLWTVIGIFVLFAVWGLVAILVGSFGGGSVGIPLLTAPA